MTDTEQIYLLLVAGAQVCDLYDDSQRARDDMRDDCLATPPHLRSDLLKHFNCLLDPHGYHSGYRPNDHVVTTLVTTLEGSAHA